MSIASDLEAFFADGKEVIVDDPLRFKAKLGIGEKAYALVRARENLTTFTEAVGVGTATSGLAGSGLVAGTFFAQSGFMATVLSTVGMGSVAVTPIGWVIGAGVATGVAYMGVARIFERSKDTGVLVIPKYINTPLDVIAVALIELMLPVSLKVAKTDNGFQSTELDAIHEFFVEEWGYSSSFLSKLIEEYLEHLDSVSFSKLSASLHEYCRDNADCDQRAIIKDFINHLREVIEADGVITDEEKIKIDYISEVLIIPPDQSVLASIWNSVGGGTKRIDSASSSAREAFDYTTAGFEATGDIAEDAASTSRGAKVAGGSAKGIFSKISSMFNSGRDRLEK